MTGVQTCVFRSLLLYISFFYAQFLPEASITTFTFNIYNSITADLGGVFSHIWSICVEEQFYLFWPILLICTNYKNHMKLCVVIVFFSLSLRFYFALANWEHYSIINYRLTPVCLDSFGLGALLAISKIRNGQLLKNILQKSFIPLIFFVMYLFQSFYKLPVWVSEVLLRFEVSVCSFFIIGNALFGFNGKLGVFLASNWVSYIGKISYGIYLYHLAISYFLDPYLSQFWDFLFKESNSILKYNSFILKFPVYFFFTVTLASFSFEYFEKQFLFYKKKLEIRWNRL